MEVSEAENVIKIITDVFIFFQSVCCFVFTKIKCYEVWSEFSGFPANQAI
jgi:hypothetical protein